VCTLILGLDVLGRGTVLVGANRDEDPARASSPPGVLVESPRVVGGRDLVAGGTWLAIRGRDAVVAMLNRRPLPREPRRAAVPAKALRSRGLLALDVAAALGNGRALAAFAAARAGEHPYAPFSLVVAAPDSCWLVTGAGVLTQVRPGWHVLTHTRLDDPAEPRAAWLGRALKGFAPPSRAVAEGRVAQLLGLHEGGGGTDPPAVCIHEGRMRTVSSALVWLAPGEAAYAHAEGPPCVTPYADHTHLLPSPPGA